MQGEQEAASLAKTIASTLSQAMAWVQSQAEDGNDASLTSGQQPLHEQHRLALVCARADC